MIGFTDFIAPYGCIGFKTFCCSILVVVDYLCLLGINYFGIKINTISQRRTVLLCSSPVINLNYLRVYLWSVYLPVLVPSVTFSAHLFTPFRPFEWFFFCFLHPHFSPTLHWRGKSSFQIHIVPDSISLFCMQSVHVSWWWRQRDPLAHQ
jgi:hypothetical protein